MFSLPHVLDYLCLVQSWQLPRVRVLLYQFLYAFIQFRRKNIPICVDCHSAICIFHEGRINRDSFPPDGSREKQAHPWRNRKCNLGGRVPEPPSKAKPFDLSESHNDGGIRGDEVLFIRGRA